MSFMSPITYVTKGEIPGGYDKEVDTRYLVFVYGTLRKKQPLHDVLINNANAEFRTVGYTASSTFGMNSTGIFPFIYSNWEKSNYKGRVWGEVYSVPFQKGIVEVLDVVEGTDKEVFKRATAEIEFQTPIDVDNKEAKQIKGRCFLYANSRFEDRKTYPKIPVDKLGYLDWNNRIRLIN